MTLFWLFNILFPQIIGGFNIATAPNFSSYPPIVTFSDSSSTFPNSTVSDQPPASSPPPQSFPIELVYAIIAIASAIVIVLLTGIVLKKKLE